MVKIRLLIIEDNRLLRNGILAILKPYKDIKIVAVSRDGKDTLIRKKKLQPDIILFDLGLRSQNSLQLMEIVKRDFPAAKIIVMDLAPVQVDIQQYINAGADGFILKDASLNDFLITIRTVAEGSIILPDLLVDSLFSQIINHASRNGISKIKEGFRMTKKEQEIILLLSDGISNKDISKKIHVSANAVKSHIHSIMEKLTLHTRLEITNFSYTDQSMNKIPDSILN